MAVFRCALLFLRPCILFHPASLTGSETSSSVSAQTDAVEEGKPWIQCRHASGMSKAAKRLEKLGLGPDGKPLPMPNYKRIYSRMYKVLMVNQDGSTYTIRHRFPHKIITLPLDLSTLSPEQLAEREKLKQAAKSRVYVEEEDLEETWEQDRYKHLIK